MSERWLDYVMAGSSESPVEALWKAAAEEAGGASLYVLGVGFDPRSLVGLQQFITALGHTPEVARIDLPPPSPASDPLARTLAADNLALFDETLDATHVRVIPYPTVHERMNAGPLIAREVSNPDFLSGFRHVVVDISSLPSTVHFPLVAALLQACDAPAEHPARFRGQVQVVACENPVVDASIRDLGISNAAVVGGFRGTLGKEGAPETVIWAPTIGERCGPALRAIHAFLNPKDTTPILPFPARRPRRADDLLLECQIELFEEFLVTPSNIIYADERNPFDLYRTLCRLGRDYREALAPLGDAMVVLSAHSSKLLSIGVLLAAYERQLPIVAAPASEYSIDQNVDLDSASQSNRVVCLWLTGAPYE